MVYIQLFERHRVAGDLVNAIEDPELKSRCLDLLSATDAFDRAAREATVILEHRIREKFLATGQRSDKPLSGIALINVAINSDVAKSQIKLSDNPSEHEGLAAICRGLMLSFRNPSHHNLLKNYSREEALKVCAFIDNILILLSREDIENRVSRTQGAKAPLRR
jgi:hypothetical protein